MKLQPGECDVSLSLPIETADGDSPVEAVEEFQRQAQQHALFVYVVTQGGVTQLVDMSDRTVRSEVNR